MQTGNFYFLSGNYALFFEQARKAENYLRTDAEACAIFCRKSLEEMVSWIFDTDQNLGAVQEYEERTLAALMHRPDFIRLIGQNLFMDINAIRKAGNLAVHNSKNKNKKITAKDAYTCIINLHAFAQWLVSYYSGTVYNEPFSINKTDDTMLQEVKIASRMPRAEVNSIQTDTSLSYHSPSEALTRQLYINILLKEAGWDTGNAGIKAEYPLKHSASGRDKADYVLFGDNGKALAVVEAKKTTADSRDKGLQQARRYADALEKEFGLRPIIFASNGFEHYIWDDLHYPYRSVQGFYSKDELETLINRRILEKPLSQQPVNTAIAGRYYQIEAIQRAKEVLEQGNRNLLFIMATGSGKTRTAAALTDVLTKANKVKRVLFLADRTPLVSQAKKAFNDYLPQLTAVNLTKDKTSPQVRMVFSTYQTMINCIDNEFEEDKRLFTPGYFDLVIFDEVHRSVYQKYKAIFNYFDAIRLGLTATPKAETHKDTYELFGLETGVPTFSYELAQAVADNFLKPPLAMRVPLRFLRQGIKYADLSDEDKQKYEEAFADSNGDSPQDIDPEALNQWLFNENTVNRVLQLLMDNGLKVNNGDTIGKTIIFAKNQEHARYIETCFNNMYPALKGHFLQVVTHSSDKPEDTIDLFKQAGKKPHIVVSVDMLDTGIDVPEILNLVFFKPVKSSAKYWQMVGRGTRLCPDIFGPDQDKQHFYIFDYCGNIEFFGDNPKGVEAVPALSAAQRVFWLKAQIAVSLEQQPENEELSTFRHDLLNGMHGEITDLNRKSFVNRPHLRSIEAFSNRNYWNNLGESKMRDIEKTLLPLLINADPDFDARRLDIICYKLMQALLAKGKALPKLISVIKSTASQLLKQTTIPQVAARKGLLGQVLNETYWQNVRIGAIEHFRTGIRELMKFIETDKQPKVYTDISDELSGDITLHDIVEPYNSTKTYQKRIASFVKKHSNFIVINKIKNHIPISVDELKQVKELLFKEDPDTAGHLDEALNGQDFIFFIRSIIGLDAAAAKALFADFINRPHISAEQISFMNTLIDYLTQNGTINRAMLFDRPFTDINQNGISGVFGEEDARKIISIIDGFNRSSHIA